ncbi:MAG: ABC transporter permease [Desulfobacterales bacterium]|nr:ABC transporter permease [Desulfobacterales bacterium]
MTIHLAWRNIWRNPRRTAVILTAVIIGVWSMVFMGALMRGVIDQMVQNGISTLTGHIQIHHRYFQRDPVIENRMAEPRLVEERLARHLPAGSRWTARIRVNAVAGNARHNTGVTLVGIDPAAEAAVSFIGRAVTRGRYLNADDPHGIVIGAALAQKFETRLGRKLVIMSQDTQKEIASRAFRIVGIFKAEMEATEKQFVFVTRPAAAKLLGMDKGVCEYAVVLPEGDRNRAASVAAALEADLPDTYSVATWRQLLPMVNAYLEIMNAWTLIWYLVVFIAMGFGIVNTMLMAVFERMREFGVLKALGTRPAWIVRDVLTESFFLLVMGMGAGSLLGLLTTMWLANVGIDLSALAEGAEYAGMSRMVYPSLYTADLVMANAVVLVLGMVISLYPAIKAARFTPVEAMGHV